MKKDNIKIYPIGGFNEVGKNMTAVDLGEDVIIFDGGLFLPPIVELEESERAYTEKKLRSIGAIPNDLILDKLGLRDKVRAIVPSHAHLDHIGALPYLAQRYDAPIIATPFTIEVLKTLFKDEKIMPRNKLISIKPNSTFYIQGKNKKYKLEFINITHSTPHTSFLALYTDEGIILYTNDFKLDNNPILGGKPNYKKIKEIAKKGIKVLICDSLYSGEERKTASERVARTMLDDVLSGMTNNRNGIIVTTFSSHIARLKSITDFGKKLNREIIFLGRSINKYVSAATRVGICPFRNDVKIATYRKQLERELKRIDRNRSNYMIVCTGHQGEPGSILDRLSRNKLPFRIQKSDNIIFSSSVIPTPVNIENRNLLDGRLKKRGSRLFKNIHVSGHAGREDLRDFLEMTKPEHIIPAHGGHDKTAHLITLAKELGYKDKYLHLTSNAKRLKF